MAEIKAAEIKPAEKKQADKSIAKKTIETEEPAIQDLVFIDLNKEGK